MLNPPNDSSSILLETEAPNVWSQIQDTSVQEKLKAAFDLLEEEEKKFFIRFFEKLHDEGLEEFVRAIQNMDLNTLYQTIKDEILEENTGPAIRDAFSKTLKPLESTQNITEQEQQIEDTLKAMEDQMFIKDLETSGVTEDLKKAYLKYLADMIEPPGHRAKIGALCLVGKLQLPATLHPSFLLNRADDFLQSYSSQNLNNADVVLLQKIAGSLNNENGDYVLKFFSKQILNQTTLASGSTPASATGQTIEKICKKHCPLDWEAVATEAFNQSFSTEETKALAEKMNAFLIFKNQTAEALIQRSMKPNPIAAAVATSSAEVATSSSNKPPDASPHTSGLSLWKSLLASFRKQKNHGASAQSSTSEPGAQAKALTQVGLSHQWRKASGKTLEERLESIPVPTVPAPDAPGPKNGSDA